MAWYPPPPPSAGQDAYYEYPPPGAYPPAGAPYAPPLLAAPPGAGTGEWASAAQPAAPLPLREAIKRLPRQYKNVLTKPGAATFAEEMGKAEWRMVWVQLMGLTVLGLIFLVVFYSIFFAIFGSFLPSSFTTFLPPLWLLLVLVSLFSLVGVPAGFFLGQGITYLLAQAFGGQGSFLAQAYNALLIQTPITIISYILAFIPIVGSVGSLIGIYVYVLEVFSLMAVHRLSGGKATAVVLIPVVAGFVLGIAVYFVFLLVFFNSFSTLFHTLPAVPTP
jgi:hypothetical protein